MIQANTSYHYNLIYSHGKFSLWYTRQMHLIEEVECCLGIQTNELPVLDMLSL